MGPLSNIGPKTSRAARDRPELNLEAKFSSRNDAGDSPDGGRRQYSVRRMAARCRAKHGVFQRHRVPSHGAPPRPTGNILRTGCWPTSTIGWQAHGAAADVLVAMRDKARMLPRAHAAVDSSIRSMTGRETPSSACTRRLDEISADGFSSKSWPEQLRRGAAEAARGGHGGGGGLERREADKSNFQKSSSLLNTLSSVSVRESRIQYLCDPQWFRDTASRGPTTIVAPESQFRTCPSDHDNVGYPRMSASGESSTTMHRLLHASGSHPIPPPNDPKTNQYNQDLGLIHSTNGNHFESPNEDSSIDHQVTIHLHAQNITMFPTNETWYFASQMLVSSSGSLIFILTAQSTRNVFRIHSDY
ncbi:hypothetical protein F511_29586 [Dorcoceras hygrometricum]|uniref:Uncharacterized protein n=1 Tax=Dorcoceras hygrometricum TaxID=472368 RepID=A0A2Z7D768_9LAMI|nr:hypothetical protein F511_29586 [Dorcoceras hygrometricum]